jgi:hypothetical protein
MSPDSCHMGILLTRVHVMRIEDAISRKCCLSSEHYVAGKKRGLRSVLMVPPAVSYTAWIVVGIQSLHFLHMKRVKQLPYKRPTAPTVFAFLRLLVEGSAATKFRISASRWGVRGVVGLPVGCMFDACERCSRRRRGCSRSGNCSRPLPRPAPYERCVWHNSADEIHSENAERSAKCRCFPNPLPTYYVFWQQPWSSGQCHPAFNTGPLHSH